MREIKFRVWNIDTERWNKLHTSNVMDSALKSRFEGEQIICQFTGLKDKNGKEIYEGDILQTTYPTSPGAKPIYKVVEWVVGHSYIGFNITNQRNNHIPREVVGNIYENPDLVSGDMPI